MKRLLLITLFIYALSACGSGQNSKEAAWDVGEESLQTQESTEVALEGELGDSDQRAQIESLNAQISEKESPFLAEIESLDAEITLIAKEDQPLWNRFWEEVKAEDLADKSFEEAINLATHMDSASRDRLMESHKKRLAITEKQNQLYDQMYQETQELMDILSSVYMAIDDPNLVFSGSEVLPIDEVENDTREDMYASVDKWLESLEGLSDKDRQAYIDLESRIRALDAEDEKDYQAYQEAEVPFRERLDALYQEAFEVSQGVDDIWEKINSEENQALMDDYTSRNPDQFNIEDLAKTMTFLSESERKRLIESEERQNKINEALAQIQNEIDASIPQVQKSLDTRMEKKTQLYWEQQAIMDKLAFTNR